MSIEIRGVADRYRSEAEGRSTLHSFAFGEHYDPNNLGFGPLIAHNDELLAVGAGYAPHLHRDTEIVTWVLSGALEHTDDLGHSSIVTPGQVQVLSAGSGITHSETNAAAVPTRFIQAWLRPDAPGTEPHYSVESVLEDEGWTVLAGEGGVPLGVDGARLYLGRGETLALPRSQFLHLFVLAGSLRVGEHTMGPGCAARLTHEGGLLVQPGEGTEVLAWAFD